MTPTRPQQQGNFQPSGDVQGRPSRPPFGSPGEGTSGGLQTGNPPGLIPTDSPNTNTFVLPNGTVVPWNTAFGGGQSQVPNQNMLERYRQYQAMQRMLPQLPPQFQQQAQSSWSQLPGWAGYLQWLQMMRPQPGIPGGVPGPTRLPLGGYPTTAGG